ncbi:hypothetical protein [Pseudoalteromonas carrageenovora]|uniref:hypothetical protein n=1 Tax=Pseudoalteromonas carrageenovora TaxID=227 RepID=UPI0026E446B1|nr:hypothetical protein [Pseudoalteromonas carrageenovora]MDO6545763.1 hypothetical protein [Pseudoalteromonas carrageenovora]MDO6830310.1 hypothetical protein [Pseudoalteromonas carrageenovora]MDO6834841.1 hypothetical protein [Pseudoalteromonas carrageenovora]
MEILGLVSLKDIILLLIGGVIGYLVNILVAMQMDKKRGLILQTTGRRIIVESASSCPFVVNDLDGNKLDNVYLINIRLWNKGKHHVERKDISADHPLKISFDKNAEILGEPVIFRGSDKIGLNIHKAEGNNYRVDFECVNPQEWSELGFFVKETPDVKVSASGRIYGQANDFNLSIDDSRTSLFERITLGLLLLFICLSPFALVWGVWWLIDEYSFAVLMKDPDSIPENLQRLLAYGIIVPMLAIMGYSQIWLKRRGNPKTYPIDEDYRPDEVKNIGALWGTALSGKNYRVSNSSRNQGEIYVPNDKNI